MRAMVQPKVFTEERQDRVGANLGRFLNDRCTISRGATSDNAGIGASDDEDYDDVVTVDCAMTTPGSITAVPGEPFDSTGARTILMPRGTDIQNADRILVESNGELLDVIEALFPSTYFLIKVRCLKVE